MPAPLLRVAAGEFAEYLLRGRRTVPKALLDAGFEFRYPTLDLAAAALALDARAVIAGPRGERTVPLASIYRDDGACPRTLDGELLVRLELGAPGPSTYRKLRPRGGFDFPEVGVAVALDADGTRGRAGAVGLGSAPLVVEGDAAPADDPPLAAALFARARPLDTLTYSPGYRRRMARVLARRAIDALLADRPAE